MRIVVVLLVIAAISGTSAAVYAAGCTMGPLEDLLEGYSEANGTKFVVDPRVKANVKLVGIDRKNINAATLIGILNVHGFVALTSNGVVYVVPEVLMPAAEEKYGEHWSG